MQLKTIKFKTVLTKAVLLLSLALFTFCNTEEELVFDSSESLLLKDSRLVELLTEVATKNAAYKGNLKSSSDTPECTGIKFPITFDAYHGDNPTPQQIVVNSDEELLEFFSTTLTRSNPYYVIFPVTLLDAEGTETEVYSINELENVLHTALDVCYSDDDNGDSNDGDDEDDEGEDNGDDDGNDDYQYCDKNNKKVYICHKGKTICVSVNAIWGHLEHHEEDYLGECE